MDGDLYKALCSSITLQTKKEGFFKDFVGYVREQSGPDLVQRFSKLQTDEERLHLCWVLPAAHSMSLRPIFKPKDIAEAEKKKEAGNAAFQRKDYRQALLLYSQSVVRAPYCSITPSNVTHENGTHVLSLSLANRSAALLHLKDPSSCLQDIQLSLRENYPQSLRHKLFERMGRCYQQLECPAKARVAFQLAIRSLSDSGLGPQKLGEKAALLKGEVDRLGSSPPPDDNVNGKDQGLDGEPQATFVSVEYSDDCGRYAVAATDVRTGDILVQEKPYAACLLPDKFGTHCHHCFARLKAPVGCQWCSGVVFCGAQCRDAACGSYHRYECPLMDLLIGSGMSILCHVALRILTQSGLQFFQELVPVLKYNPTETHLHLDTPSSQYLHVFNLVTLEDKRCSDDFLDRCLMAVFLLQCLRKTTFFSEGESGEGMCLSDSEVLIGRLLLHHLQFLQFNAHEVHEYQMVSEGQFKGSKSVYIGVALYPTVACFNHSCYPGVTRYFNGTSMVIRAIRPIKQGEMIAENYGPIFTHKRRSERLKSLRSRYWFDCLCPACREDWGTFEELANSDKMNARCLQCPRGKQTVVPVGKQCPVCKGRPEAAWLKKRIEDIRAHYQEGLDLMEKGEVDEAISEFCRYIDKMDLVISAPYQELHLSQQALRMCMASRGSVYFVGS